jgi:ATP-binding cassette subfamily B protein
MMTASKEARDSNRTIIERYTDQPQRLPYDLRARIERSWGGLPVQLYAMADLDASLRLARTWVALGPRHVAVARQPEGAGRTAVHSFERARIRLIREAPGLSCTVLTLLGSADEPPLAVWRYTHRQHRAFENLRFVLEEKLEGRHVEAREPDAEYAESLAAPIKEAQALVAPNRLAVLWRLLAYLRPYRWHVYAGFAAALLITLFSLVPPYVTGYLIDEVIEPVQDGTLSLAEASAVAWLGVLAIALVYALRQLCGFVRLRLMTVLGEYVARDLRTELYEHLQTLSMAFYSRKKTGSLITRVSSDTDRLWEFLALGIVDVSLAVVMLIGLSAVLLSLDWRLGLAMTLPLPPLCFVILRHGQFMNKMFLRAWRKWSNVTDVLADTIPGMRVVKAFNQEEREKHRFEQRNADATSEFNRLHTVWTSFWPLLMLCVRGMTVGVWVLAIPRLLGSTDLLGPPLSAGTFVSFVLYTTMFIQPIDVIGQMTRVMNRATSSAHRVFEVLDTEPQVVDLASPKRLTPVLGRVAFENVTFGYDGVRQVLRSVSFEVERGEMVGLVGPSGGGKTTITNLIARFYDVTGGCIRIDGCDIRQLETGHYRQQIGMVLQEPFLFHGTVLENIRYGRPDASVGDAVTAARAANAHDFICDLAHGYDTMIGERGQTLSGGERQRISIARAILCDPRILILDEATSSVDTETEQKIQEALDRLVAGRTVFAIAHRLSTLARADRLFVVEDGRIVERGTHAELLDRPSGRYRKLYTLQRRLAHAV